MKMPARFAIAAGGPLMHELVAKALKVGGRAGTEGLKLSARNQAIRARQAWSKASRYGPSRHGPTVLRHRGQYRLGSGARIERIRPGDPDFNQEAENASDN